jgi:hypothetical protein
MRVLLRHLQNGHFYAGASRWTEDPATALDFQETDRAMDAVWNEKISGVEILMHFEDPQFQIPLSIVGFGR